MDLIAKAATAANPDAKQLLDIGCGAGNYTLKLLQSLPLSEITLIDLSQPMLERARQRISAVTSARSIFIRWTFVSSRVARRSMTSSLPRRFLHHLRSDDEWRSVFAKIHRSLKPGGSFWVSDLVHHSNPAVQAMMWERYGDYLVQLKGEDYREQVFAYIEQEDSPRPLLFQLDLLREVGFQEIEVLHKNSCFAAFGAIK